MIKKSNVVILA